METLPSLNLEKVKVSVAMITYNHEKFIGDALDGILMQETNFDFNIVIRDDASTDKTNAIIQKYLVNFPGKFDYKSHRINIGMMPNFISALQSCKSNYIALCEGDDYWTDKKKLQTQVSFLDSNQNYAGCFHNVNFSNEAKPSVSLKPWRTYNKMSFELKDTFSKVALFHTCSFLFRRESLEIPEWFEKVKSGDMALFSLIASKGKLRLIDEVMAVYRKTDTGVTSNLREINYHRSRLKLISFFKTSFSEHVRTLDNLKKYHKKEIKRIYKIRIMSFIKRHLKL